MSQDKFSDSAGVPWEGRSFGENPFKDDTGLADQDLLAAIENFKVGAGSPSLVIEAFAKSRLLIPLIANLGAVGEGVDGLKADKSAELSIVTVMAPDGQKALPVFSSVATMQAWDPKARPVPNHGRAIALAAASEGNSRIVLDPTSSTEFVIRRPAIVSIAQATEWISPEVNPEVSELVADLLSEIDDVESFELVNGDPQARLANQELIITLYLRSGLAEDKLDSIEKAFFAGLANSERFVELVDSVAVRYLPVS